MVRCRPTREEQTSQRGASLPVIVSGCSKALRHSSSWMAPSCFASGDVTAGALIVLVGMVTGDDDSSNTTCFRPGVGARRCVVRRLPVDPVNLPPDGGAGLGGGVGVIGGAGRCTVSTDGRVIGTDKSRKGSRCSAVCPHARQVELVQNPPQNVRRTNVSLGERIFSGLDVTSRTSGLWFSFPKDWLGRGLPPLIPFISEEEEEEAVRSLVSSSSSACSTALMYSCISCWSAPAKSGRRSFVALRYMQGSSTTRLPTGFPVASLDTMLANASVKHLYFFFVTREPPFALFGQRARRAPPLNDVMADDCEALSKTFDDVSFLRACAHTPRAGTDASTCMVALR